MYYIHIHISEGLPHHIIVKCVTQGFRGDKLWNFYDVKLLPWLQDWVNQA